MTEWPRGVDGEVEKGGPIYAASIIRDAVFSTELDSRGIKQNSIHGFIVIQKARNIRVSPLFANLTTR